MVIFKFQGETVREAIEQMTQFIASIGADIKDPSQGELTLVPMVQEAQEPSGKADPGPAQTVTPELADVRKATSKFGRVKGAPALKEVLQRFGAASLGELQVADYPAVIEAVQV